MSESPFPCGVRSLLLVLLLVITMLSPGGTRVQADDFESLGF